MLGLGVRLVDVQGRLCDLLGPLVLVGLAGVAAGVGVGTPGQDRALALGLDESLVGQAVLGDGGAVDMLLMVPVLLMLFVLVLRVSGPLLRLEELVDEALRLIVVLLAQLGDWGLGGDEGALATVDAAGVEGYLFV